MVKRFIGGMSTFERTFLLIWVVILISGATYAIFSKPADANTGIVTAFIAVVGILATVLNVLKYRDGTIEVDETIDE